MLNEIICLDDVDQEENNRQNKEKNNLQAYYSKKANYFTPIPSQNSYSQLEEKTDLNDDKETVVDVSFISQTSNKQSFGVNKVIGLQLSQQNKNLLQQSNQIEIFNNTETSSKIQFGNKNYQEGTNNINNNTTINNNNKINAMTQSFSNQNTDNSKSSSYKRDESEANNKYSSTEVYSIPGPKNINSSQYQYVQPTQIQSLQKINLSQNPQILINSTNPYNNTHKELQNIQNQTVDSLMSSPKQMKHQQQQQQVYQDHQKQEAYQQHKIHNQQTQNKSSERVNTQPSTSRKQYTYPSEQDFLKENDLISDFSQIDPIHQCRVDLLRILLSHDLQEQSKSKLLKDQYCIHKTEHYELCIKSNVSKSKYGNMNNIAYSFIIKNKTLSDIKEVSISLHNQPKNCEVEFDRAQILINQRNQEYVKMTANTTNYPIHPIDCSFLIGNYVPIKHFQVYHSIMRYISTTTNTQDLQRWNPKYKKVILHSHNPNIFIQKSPLYEFYHVKLKEEDQQRVGYFQLCLPLKSEVKVNKENVMRFKIAMRVDKNFTISISDFFNDFSNEFRSKNLKLILDQILMTLAYIFGTNQAISELYESEKSNLIQMM